MPVLPLSVRSLVHRSIFPNQFHSTLILRFTFFGDEIDGLSAGGFSCLWQRFAMLVAPSEPKSGNLIAFFTTSRGIANILTGPIAGALLDKSASEVQGYRMLVHYSGIIMIISSLGVAIRFLYTPKNTL